MTAVRRSPRLSALAGLLLVAGGASACQGDEPEPATVPSSPSTPLESLDTTALTVVRGPFCTDVAPASVQDVLGAEVESSTSYDNGDPARLTGRVKDVAHEFGCTWTAVDGGTARAWVFAPPVTAARARALGRAARGPGCTPIPDAPAFGEPSTSIVCRSRGRLEASYRGLFGDAWLTCTLSVAKPEPADLTERADAWCGSVLTAAAR